MSIILASQSPRREELLKKIHPEFKIVPANIDETIVGKTTPEDYVLAMAQKKAQWVAKQHPHQLVIGCDTIVSIDGNILGKPVNEQEARKMLRGLSGRKHQVYTAVYIMDATHIEQKVVEAEVTFLQLAESEITAYLATGEYKDKAGAYGIQGQGALLVEKVNGDYYAIVGLPIAQVKRMMAQFTV